MEERKQEATINGTPLTVLGSKVSVGAVATDVELLEYVLCPFKLLADTAGKIRVISVVPCIDTGLCEMQTLRISEEARRFNDQVVAITISTDVPASLERWCGRTGVDNVLMLSDHLNMNFGAAYGTWLKEMRSEQRSIFVVDANNIVRHAEYVPEVGHAINYEAALAAIRELLAASEPAAQSVQGFSERPTSKEADSNHDRLGNNS